jgi:hypothetical protein
MPFHTVFKKIIMPKHVAHPGSMEMALTRSMDSIHAMQATVYKNIWHVWHKAFIRACVYQMRAWMEELERRTTFRVVNMLDTWYSLQNVLPNMHNPYEDKDMTLSEYEFIVDVLMKDFNERDIGEWIETSDAYREDILQSDDRAICPLRMHILPYEPMERRWAKIWSVPHDKSWYDGLRTAIHRVISVPNMEWTLTMVPRDMEDVRDVPFEYDVWCDCKGHVSFFKLDNSSAKELGPSVARLVHPKFVKAKRIWSSGKHLIKDASYRPDVDWRDIKTLCTMMDDASTIQLSKRALWKDFPPTRFRDLGLVDDEEDEEEEEEDEDMAVKNKMQEGGEDAAKEQTGWMFVRPRQRQSHGGGGGSTEEEEAD